MPAKFPNDVFSFWYWFNNEDKLANPVGTEDAENREDIDGGSDDTAEVEHLLPVHHNVKGKQKANNELVKKKKYWAANPAPRTQLTSTPTTELEDVVPTNHNVKGKEKADSKVMKKKKHWAVTPAPMCRPLSQSMPSKPLMNAAVPSKQSMKQHEGTSLFKDWKSVNYNRKLKVVQQWPKNVPTPCLR